MHPQLACCFALVALVFLQHRQDKPLLELAHRLGVQDIALVHLHDECFELVSHGISLSGKERPLGPSRLTQFLWQGIAWLRDALLCARFLMQQSQALVKAGAQIGWRDPNHRTPYH